MVTVSCQRCGQLYEVRDGHAHMGACGLCWAQMQMEEREDNDRKFGYGFGMATLGASTILALVFPIRWAAQIETQRGAGGSFGRDIRLWVLEWFFILLGLNLSPLSRPLNV